MTPRLTEIYSSTVNNMHKLTEPPSRLSHLPVMSHEDTVCNTTNINIHKLSPGTTTLREEQDSLRYPKPTVS